MKMKGITRKKLSPSSSYSIFSRVFPLSWFSKRKQKVEKPETKKKDQLESLFPNSGARCHSMDWGNSFRDEIGNFPARRSTGGMTISSIFYEPDHEFAYFDDMVLDMKRVKGRAKESEQERVGAFDRMARNKMCSPITESKIRALEEMKRAAKDEVEGKSVFNSFAVVRNSFDPHRDFRDSMVKMITEERIGRAEEEDLELLLACYLDLNSHVYHGIIIKVFKHVWFELRGHN